MAIVAGASRQVMQIVVARHAIDGAMVLPRPFFRIVLEFASNGKHFCRIGFCPALLYETSGQIIGCPEDEAAHWICRDLVLRQASRGYYGLAQQRGKR
jgi:hypothetical protein